MADVIVFSWDIALLDMPFLGSSYTGTTPNPIAFIATAVHPIFMYDK